MSEPSTDQLDDHKPELGNLDPDQFVGGPSAGDATPGEFTSTDLSAGHRQPVTEAGTGGPAEGERDGPVDGGTTDRTEVARDE